MRFQTLSEALDSVEAERVTSGEVVPVGSIREPFSCGGVAYGETRSASIQLEKFKGKATRKYLHVQIYRDESGLYEANTYAL